MSFPFPIRLLLQDSLLVEAASHPVHTGDGLEGLSELPPEQAVVKLQRQNARLRRKAEAAMALEQENGNLKSQLHDMANQMVRPALTVSILSKSLCFIVSLPYDVLVADRFSVVSESTEPL